MVELSEFVREKECVYKGERYSVRDNGAVLRHKLKDKRVRKNDNQWTFGKENTSNAYLYISDERIHRIVATAFHGEPIDPKHVVDHIDTNCRNNRPENLQWVSRLENVLSNPITRKRIEFYCGSIEAFLENPSILNGCNIDPNFKWMRTVTKEEAQNCRDRLYLWAAKSGKKNRNKVGNKSIDENIYKPLQKWELFGREPGLDKALTKGCVQYKWKTPSYFPCCPNVPGVNPLNNYYSNLKVGEVFSYNDNYPKSKIVEFVKINNNPSILVMCEKESLKPWLVAEITYKDGLFIHTNLGSFFDKSGADKEFCIKQGLIWTGGDTFDDLCG